MTVMVMGLPGSGKSYFAVQLAALMNAEYINSDKVRSAMLDAATYSDKEKWMIYDEMLRQAVYAAEAGRDVVVDATFYKQALREAFARALERAGGVVWIEVLADEELIRERLRRPRRESDANYEVYKEIREEWEPMTDAHLLLRSTNENIDNMVDQAIEYIHQEAYE